MKKKKTAIIVVIIVLILAIVGVFAYFYFFTDTFKSSSELFIKYFAKNSELLDLMENANLDEQNELKKSNSYISSGELTVVSQDETDTIQINATTESRYDLETDRTYSELTIKNGEDDLLEVSFINSSDVYAIKCDDVLSNYIGVRNSSLRSFAQNMGLDTEIVQCLPDSIEFDAIESLFDITDSQEQHIIDTYSDVIVSSLSEEYFTKLGSSTITVDDTSYKVNGYSLSLDEETVVQIIENCLEILKDDDITLVMISNKLSDLGIDTQYVDYTKLSSGVEELLTAIQETSFENDIAFDICVYENSGELIRTEFTIEGYGVITIDKTSTDSSEKAIISVTTVGETIDMSSIIETITDDANTSEEETETSTEVETTDTTETVVNEEAEESEIVESSDTTTTTMAQEGTTSQIILQKIVSDSSIINEIKIVPDMTNTMQTIVISTSTGAIINNSATNSNDVTISLTEDGEDVQTLQASYLQTIETASEVTEIMELLNSNTVIFNNYTSDELTPFLTSIEETAEDVLENKMTQLGIDITSDETAETLLEMLLTAGLSAASANGMDLNAVSSYITGGVVYIADVVLDVIDLYSTEELTETEITEYNSQFATYEGTISGANATLLCESVIEHNAEETEEYRQINVTNEIYSGEIVDDDEDVTYATEEQINEVIESLNTNSNYTVTFEYTSNGLVKNIGISQE